MNQKSFFQKPLFWAALSVISLICVFFLINNFDRANPIVNLEVQMSREEALEKAKMLADELDLGPDEYRQAASFSNDTKFQYYAELEGGGLEKFTEAIENEAYASYKWRIRHFKEKEVNEVSFYFKPDGTFYGFQEKIAEELLRTNLSADSALLIAKNKALAMGKSLSNYELVEKSVDELPKGRIDHRFVFERNDLQLAESNYRLAIKVSGDKVSEVRNFVDIPEDFERRFEEMRSANSLVGMIGQAILFILYGLIGVGLGIFFLMKKRFILWRKALFWSLGIGLLSGILFYLNMMPLLWLDYDTANTTSSFVGQQLMLGLVQTLVLGGVVFISALAGEGLGRYVFPHQIQFWKVWTGKAGGSLEVLGQTLGGYLFVPVFLAIDVLYYLLTSNYLGWWNPAGMLSDPDVLAQVFPWFGSIAISLQAGFWEEIICRAVPLAGVYLLVRNKKSKNFWMILTLFAQTIIFGMLHASYPQSPSYARVLEMIVPFVIFGLIYLRFGLLPVIIAHYAIDVFWISLPLWAASSPGIWANRIMVIIFFLVPLFIVFYFRVKNGKWFNVPDSLRNSAWQPAIKQTAIKEFVEEDVQLEERKVLSPVRMKWLLPAALIALIAWVLLSFPVEHQTPEVKLSRKQAIELAKNEASARFDLQTDEWTLLTQYREGKTLGHYFIWSEYENSYDSLQGGFLNEPYWKVRFVKTDADVEDRAEEYDFKIDNKGRLLAFRHTWPEKRPGARLDEESAKELAREAVSEFSPDQNPGLKVVSAKPDKRDSRTDWEIEFSDTLNYSIGQGQGRYWVSISGDEISSLGRYVFVPEEWEREYKKTQSKVSIVKMISSIFVYAILILGLVLGFIQWSKKQFCAKSFWYFGIAYFVISVLGTWLKAYSLTGSYSIELPYNTYIIMLVIGALLSTIFFSLLIGVLTGFSCKMASNDLRNEKDFRSALLLGLIFTLLYTLKDKFLPQLNPYWIEAAYVNSKVPLLSYVIGDLMTLIVKPSVIMITFYMVNLLTDNFRKLKLLGIAIVFITGFLALGANVSAMSSWYISGFGGAIIFIVMFLLLRRHIAWIPVIFAVKFALDQVEMISTGVWVNIVVGGILAIIVSIAVAWFWLRMIKQFKK